MKSTLFSPSELELSRFDTLTLRNRYEHARSRNFFPLPETLNSTGPLSESYVIG